MTSLGRKKVRINLAIIAFCLLAFTIKAQLVLKCSQMANESFILKAELRLAVNKDISTLFY